jgi:type III pantothenate kinase
VLDGLIAFGDDAEYPVPRARLEVLNLILTRWFGARAYTPRRDQKGGPAGCGSVLRLKVSSHQGIPPTLSAIGQACADYRTDGRYMARLWWPITTRFAGEAPCRICSLMLLGVDVGNSMVKFALFDAGHIVARWMASNDSHATKPAQLRADLHTLGVAKLTAVALASVGPRGDAWFDALAPLAPDAALRLHAGLDLGIANAYQQPSSVGIDRLLNTLAAHVLYGGPAVVADIGTATNFECVGIQGEFLGGAICAGPQLGLDALGARSNQLLHINFEAPQELIATNTSDALKCGAHHGHSHMVSGLLKQFRAALPSPCKMIVTGGYAGQLFPVISHLLADVPAGTLHWDPELTLQGVRLAFERVTAIRGVA